MAEIVADKKVCEACAADVRVGSLFCYNCGRSVEASVNANRSGNEPPTAEPGVEFNGGNRSGSPAMTAGPGVPQKARTKRGRQSYVRPRERVAWVAREDPPKLFMAVTVVIVVFSALLLIIAMLLK